MARPATPTSILDAKGSFLKHPERKRDAEMQPGPLGKPSKVLDAKKQKIWRELERMIPSGVLKSTDRFALETLVLLKAKERARKISASERGQMITLYGRFGLTPSDRAKVKAESDPQDKLAAFLTRGKKPA